MNREVIDNNTHKKYSRIERKEARRERLRKKYFKENDIKYQGPLSYRFLRIFAWIAIAIGQVALLNSLATSLLGLNYLTQIGQTIFSFISSLSTPFFIIASFGLVLNKKRGFRNYILLYGAAFLAFGLGACFFYYRYINGVFIELGIEQTKVAEIVTNFISDKVQFNVFADLFAFALFNFFVNYTPKRLFPGKTVIIFRLFTLLPIAFVVVSYVLKVLYGFSYLDLPFYVFPFFTTKSPLVFAVFAIACLWIKNRERLFLRLGATKEDYQKFLLTNRNSLSFSVHLSIIIALSLIVEFLAFFVLLIIYAGFMRMETSEFVKVLIDIYGCGQCSVLAVAIPIIFLYSYTRDHNNQKIDIIIPIVGIGLIALVYLEGFYQFITIVVTGV